MVLLQGSLCACYAGSDVGGGQEGRAFEAKRNIRKRARPSSEVVDLPSSPLICVPSSRFRIIHFILRSWLQQLVILNRILRPSLSPQSANRGLYQITCVLPVVCEPSEVLLHAVGQWRTVVSPAS